jgi:hypothetical protein
MIPEPSAEQRSGSDRRRLPTTVWDAIFCGGQRAMVRREPERQRPHFVDRFPPTTLVWILLLLVFTVADGLLTLELIEAGYHELNPIMHYFLVKGPAYFVIGKYVLAAAGLPILVLFGNRSRIKYVVPIFVSLYAALITYQLLLVRSLE